MRNLELFKSDSIFYIFNFIFYNSNYKKIITPKIRIIYY